MKTAEELQAELDSVLTKRDELLREVKTLKAKAKGADIDPEEFAKLQSDNEELRSALDKTSKTSKAEIERLTKTLSEREGKLHDILVDGGITEALAKANVAPELMKAAKALLKSGAAVKEGAAFMGDKPLADAIAEWSASDEGKHFVRAPVNSGGGGQGGGGSGQGKKFSDMTSEERTALYRTNPQQYEAAKAAS